jgi:hypothetical protein
VVLGDAIPSFVVATKTPDPWPRQDAKASPRRRRRLKNIALHKVIWVFQRVLFVLQMCIMLCADHGPCVSGAHNSMVTARAGKDLVSSLVSGKLVCFLYT